MRLKIGIIQGLHKQLRYTLQAYDKDGKEAFGWSDVTPEYTTYWLERHKIYIETAEFWANASPVPPEALAAVAKMKEILGAEKCL